MGRSRFEYLMLRHIQPGTPSEIIHDRTVGFEWMKNVLGFPEVVLFLNNVASSMNVVYKISITLVNDKN